MVPSYDSSVSPPTSRAMSGTKSGTKLDHSEEERKILLVAALLIPFYWFLATWKYFKQDRIILVLAVHEIPTIKKHTYAVVV